MPNNPKIEVVSDLAKKALSGTIHDLGAEWDALTDHDRDLIRRATHAGAKVALRAAAGENVDGDKADVEAIFGNLKGPIARKAATVAWKRIVAGAREFLEALIT